MATTLTRWLPAPPVRPHTVIPRLMMLEDRVNPAYLFVDFGDRFPGGTLATTQGGLQDVANDPIPGNRILGSTLEDAAGGFNAATPLNIVAQTFSPTARASMMAVVRRSFLPLNVTVVELRNAAQTTADGRTVRGAASMADVIATLRGGTASSKDAYVFVSRFVVAPGTPNQQIYGPNGGGISPGGTTLDTTDLQTGVNNHDDVALVYTDSSFGFNYNTMNNISHEAGHNFGHQHSITNGFFYPTDQQRIHEAEIMSYLNSNTSSSSMFARFPMVRGDNNFGNYEDIASRNGGRTSHDQFRTDPNIGENPLYSFISGTGADDIITVTRNGAFADVTVRAFGDSSYTTPIAVPGSGGATSFTYTVPLTRTLLIHAGGGADSIELDGDLGVDVRLDGMLDTDTLTVNGKGAASAVYTPAANSSVSVDQTGFSGGLVTSFGGVVTIGGANITFENYETAGQVTIRNVVTVTVNSQSGVDAFTLGASGGRPRVSGTVNGGTAFVPLVTDSVTRLLIDAGNGDAGPVADTLTIDLSGGPPALPGGVTFAGGTGADTVRLTGASIAAATLTLTGPAAGVFSFPGGGPIDFITTETVDLSGASVAALTVVLPGTANTASLEDDGTTGNLISRLRSTSGSPTFPIALIGNPSGTLTLLGGTAADDITVAALPDFTSSLAIGTTATRFAAVTFTGPVALTGTGSLTAFSSGNITLPNATSDLTTSGSGAIRLTADRSVLVAAGASVTTASGDITLSGNQQAVPSTGTFVGVEVIGAVGSNGGRVSVSGRGGTSAGGNQYGVSVRNGGSIFTTTSGSIVIAGDGGAAGGGNNHGVFVSDSGSVVSSGTGSGGTSVIGRAGSGTPSSGVWVTSGGTLASGGNGDLTVTTDNLYVETAGGFEGTLRAGGSGTRTATLQPLTPNAFIDLGGAGVPPGTAPTLSLTDALLDRVQAGTLVIGRATAAGIRLTADLDRATPTAFRLVTAGDIGSTLTAGRLNTAGGALTLSAATVTPLRTGLDFIASSVSFTAGTALAIAITGPVADAGYPQLSVSGTLNLNGVTLALSGGYVPAAGEAFPLTSAATGVFAAPAAASVVTFNGVQTHLLYPAGVASLVVNRPAIGLSAGGPYTINRGDGLVVSAAGGVSDPDGDPLAFSWDVNGDGVFGDEAFGTVSDGGRTVTYTPAQVIGVGLSVGARTRPVTVRATDGLNFGTATASTTLTINGLGVTITSLDGPSAGVEGGAITFTATVTSTGSLPVNYNWTVLKNGAVFATANTATGTFTFTPDDDGTYTVQLQATNTGDGLDTASRSVTVTNLPPVITSFGVTKGGVAGTLTVLSVAATDPAGASDPLTYTWVLTRNGVAVGSGSGPTFSFTPPGSGTYRVDVTVSDGDGGTASTSRTFGVPPRPVVVTSLAGTVRVRDVISGVTQVLIPFADFVGEVHVASGDLNGDGVLDLVVAAGPGGGPHVRVFDGATGMELASFFAFDVGFTGGVTVAATTGRIVVGAGAGGGPHVKLIDFARIRERRADGVIAESALVGNFFAFDVSFTGGVTVAAADVNRDGRVDVVVGAKSGGGPHVKVIDGGRMNDVQNGVINSAALLFNFFAFDAAFTGGVTVAAADGRFAVGAGAGGESRVRAIDGVSGGDLANLPAYPGFNGGVRVAFADVNTDAQPDLITAAGPGGGPHVKAFGLAPLVALESVFIGEGIDTRGVYV